MTRPFQATLPLAPLGDAALSAQVQAALDAKTKPRGALGRLEGDRGAATACARSNSGSRRMTPRTPMWNVRTAFAGLLVGLLLACVPANSPPLFHTRAKAFLASRGVAPELADKLVNEQPLAPDEALQLVAFDDPATLHLVAANAGTPAEWVARLAEHRSEEVRWGAATNAKLTPDAQSRLRTPGRYSTMNSYLARNPALPAELIRTMYRTNEASAASIAMNPSCPPDVVDDILANQPEDVRIWLAWNRGLSADVFDRLERDPSDGVARMLRANPSYERLKRQRSQRAP